MRQAHRPLHKSAIVMSSDHASRKRPIHGVIDIDGQPTIIFDTVCTKGRRPWLATVEVHSLLRKVWSESTAWALGRYIILPDHIHFFAGATGQTIPYDNWVRYWKSQFTKLHGVSDHRWQSDHWDTRIRTFELYEEKWQYVLMNPVRHGLVNEPGEWPYQGEIHKLQWN